MCCQAPHRADEDHGGITLRNAAFGHYLVRGVEQRLSEVAEIDVARCLGKLHHIRVSYVHFTPTLQ